MIIKLKIKKLWFIFCDYYYIDNKSKSYLDLSTIKKTYNIMDAPAHGACF